VEESDMTDTDWIVLKGDTALCLHPRRNSSSVLKWRLAIACARERPEAEASLQQRSSKVAVTPDGCPKASTNVGLLCHPAQSSTRMIRRSGRAPTARARSKQCVSPDSGQTKPRCCVNNSSSYIVTSNDRSAGRLIGSS